MTEKWGVIDVRDDDGRFIAYHVMPVILSEGEWITTDSHEMSENCQCNPFLSHGNGGWPLWNHFDADFPGGLSAEEFNQQAQEAEKEWEAMQRLELEAEKAEGLR
jgi:hypothetical protein